MITRPYLFYRSLLLSVATLIIAVTPAAAEVWTLEKSIQRAVNSSPEQHGLAAGIAVRKFELQQAGIWPTPTISLRTQNRLGLNGGTAGYNLDQLSITQSLPIWRLQKQKAVANKQLSAEQAFAEKSLLTIQADIARLYYALLFSHETLLLAEKRLHFTDTIIHALSRKNSHVIRYINPLERHRIELLHEIARRNTLKAQAGYEEARQVFRLRLQLPGQTEIQLPSMHLAAAPPGLKALLDRLDKSSASIKQIQYQLDMEEANIGLEEARRFNDPELSLIYERDILNNRRQNFKGVMLTMSMPLWNSNAGNIARAEAISNRTRSRLQIARRDLSTQLRQNHLLLSHLLQQHRTFQKQMIDPAEQLLNLTRQSYTVGEVNSLNLIDAYNTYFNALKSNISLVYQSNMVATDLYQSVGDPALHLSQTGAIQ
ncbi:MAG: TolC family protein [Mariprofundus sp.]|nr:TolC family protein [Mariprofundus sp.]